jgi:hypothetical protein
MAFCNAFDAHLAASGPAAVFLPDHEGLYRFDASWTRDAWERAPGPHAPGWRWVLVRDGATGFVQLVLATSPTLLAAHPRGDVRAFVDEAEARAARDAFGRPPVSPTPW